MHLTPTRLLVLNLAGSAGEMVPPFLVGAAFERGSYGIFGMCLVALSALPGRSWRDLAALPEVRA